MDTPLSHKDRNGTSHNHNQYIKHDSTVHVQDPLTSHYPPGPTQPTGLWLPTTQHRQIYGEGEPVPVYTPPTDTMLQQNNLLPRHRQIFRTATGFQYIGRQMHGEGQSDGLGSGEGEHQDGSR